MTESLSLVKDGNSLIPSLLFAGDVILLSLCIPAREEKLSHLLLWHIKYNISLLTRSGVEVEGGIIWEVKYF